MSRKKVLPRLESRFVSRDPAHFPSASLQGFCLLVLISFSATGGNSIELRERQASVVDCVNHGSIRGSWPMAISGYPRGHNVKWVTRCPRHTGQISLTDTSLEPSISRTRRPLAEGTLRMEGASPAMLKLLVAATVWGRNSLPSSTWLR